MRHATGAHFVILDCHGGLTATSFAAFDVASDVVIVTEADPVTFGGTLTLVQALRRRVNPESPPRHIHFLINRIPPKFKSEDLSSLYRRAIVNELAVPGAAGTCLHLIPTEQRLSEFFGEYPFHVELEPRGVFAGKMRLLAASFCREEGGVRAGELMGWGPLKRERRRRRLQRTIRSDEVRATRTMYAVCVVLLVVGLVGVPINAIVWSKMTAGSNLERIVEISGLVLFLGSGLYLLYAGVHLLRHFWRTTRFHFRAMAVLPATERTTHAVLSMRNGTVTLMLAVAMCGPIWWHLVERTIGEGIELGATPASLGLPQSLGSGQPRPWEEQARRGALSAGARLEGQGYRLVDEPLLAEFRQDPDTVAVEYEWVAGRAYWVVAGCDGDCTGLEVLASGALELHDDLPGDTPEILVISPDGGRHPIHLAGRCTTAFCSVAVARYDREGPSRDPALLPTAPGGLRTRVLEPTS
jgi:hypothetical protein